MINGAADFYFQFWILFSLQQLQVQSTNDNIDEDWINNNIRFPLDGLNGLLYRTLKAL